ncbi:MAG: ABC transporter substrate-binding protein [Actinomycetota bacterium]|nr:ABC transporter substrate-binding protein [Actinomycetota bacterium]
MKKLVVVVASALALATACGSSSKSAIDTPTTAGGPKKVVIAVGGPFSGDDKAVGDQIRAGAKLAADQINAKGGITGGPLKGAQVEIDDGFDDADVPQKAVDNIRKVVDNDKYIAFVGSGLSDASVAAAPVASQAGLSYLAAYASSPKILEAATAQKSVFVVPPTFPAYAFSMVDQLTKKGLKKPAIIHLTGTYGDGIADLVVEGLKGSGIATVANESFKFGDAEFTTQLGKIKDAGPDSLVMVGLPDSDALIVKQAEQLGLGVPVFDPGGITNSDTFIKDAGNLANGVVGNTPSDAQRNTPAAIALRDAYSAATKESVVPDPAVFADEGVQAVAVGLADGAGTRLELSDHLHRISIDDTGVGPLKFAADGSRIGGRLYIFQVRDDKPVFTVGYEQTGPKDIKEISLER